MSTDDEVEMPFEIEPSAGTGSCATYTGIMTIDADGWIVAVYLDLYGARDGRGQPVRHIDIERVPYLRADVFKAQLSAAYADRITDELRALRGHVDVNAEHRLRVADVL